LSEDPRAGYSGYHFATHELLVDLQRIDQDGARKASAALSPGVQADCRAVAEFWDRYRGHAQRVSRAVNNAYLRANGVAEGIRSYRMSARLLVSFARRNGGSCILAREPP
jgi:hypothetical protein